MTKINKEGWEIKKLGEVATIVSGATPKTNIPEYWGEGNFWITPAEIKEGDIEISKTERTITDEAVAHTNVNLLPEGTVLLSSRAPIGKVAIAAVPMYCNQGFKNCICKESLHNKFLFYFLRCKNELLQSLGRGATFKEISKSIVEGIKIPLPPLPIQQHIVEELDEINAIISAKKQQISKLDELAQCIFYNMFGDPVANDKGWEVKELGKVCTKLTDGSHNPPQGVDKSDFLMLSSKNVTFQGFTFEEPRYLTKEQFESENKRTNVSQGDVFLVIVGAGVGKCCVYTFDVPITLQRSVAVLRPDVNVIQGIFLNAFLHAAHDFICSNANGAAQKGIYLKQLSKINIPLPPLPLQEAFAARVAVIEEQKSSIAASIEKMQTLLDARMQEYFG